MLIPQFRKSDLLKWKSKNERAGICTYFLYLLVGAYEIIFAVIGRWSMGILYSIVYMACRPCGMLIPQLDRVLKHIQKFDFQETLV
jgi:hypothetical protein